ncbi:unnamed protein product [Prunus armeniaca]
MISGLFQLGSSYEWVITKKTGRSSESDLLAAAERESKMVNQLQVHGGASERTGKSILPPLHCHWDSWLASCNNNHFVFQ